MNPTGTRPPQPTAIPATRSGVNDARSGGRGTGVGSVVRSPAHRSASAGKRRRLSWIARRTKEWVPRPPDRATVREDGISDRRGTWLEASFPARGAIGNLGGTIDRTYIGHLAEKPRVAWTFGRKAR